MSLFSSSTEATSKACISRGEARGGARVALATTVNLTDHPRINPSWLTSYFKIYETGVNKEMSVKQMSNMDRTNQWDKENNRFSEPLNLYNTVSVCVSERKIEKCIWVIIENGVRSLGKRFEKENSFLVRHHLHKSLALPLSHKDYWSWPVTWLYQKGF